MEDCCGNCDAFRAPKAVPALAAAKSWAPPARGDCRRLPQSVPKNPDEWCSLHRPGADEAPAVEMADDDLALFGRTVEEARKSR